MVEVKLAGMNVPVYILKDIKELRERIDESSRLRGSELLRILVELEELSEQFTPEILSAAYARISRSPEDVNELVVEASQDVTKARKSNENIIYGMGHHSVADHAIFNFNITGVSRLAVESIEERRIAGYTEKSQRYITLDGDYVKPKEFSSEDLKKFEELVEFQNDFYFRNNPKLFDYLKKKFSKEINKLEGRKKKDYEKKLEGSAKEDARYSLCLATEAQLGCSYPGQTLELAIRKLKHGRLTEEREISKQLFDETVQYAPSLIQLTDPEIFRQHNPGQELQEDNFKYTKQNLRDIVEKAFEKDIKPVDSSTLKFYRFSHDTPFASLRDEDLGNKDLAVFFKNGNATFVKC
ncbi:FAD-dependent thymidylate synthase, partial [Candidatus Woesearchaeota archaeon]|nr:FAD-dependent thymidylate synthase [Candidatus Woesearchaeota archaeon]